MQAFSLTPSNAVAGSRWPLAVSVAIHCLVLGLPMTVTPAEYSNEAVRPLTVWVATAAPSVAVAPPRRTSAAPRPRAVAPTLQTQPVLAGLSGLTVTNPVETAPSGHTAPVSPAGPTMPDPVAAVEAGLTPTYFDTAYLDTPKPVYPLLSRRFGEEGRVVLRVQVAADGQTRAAEIEASSGFARLDGAARDAVRRWRFLPAQRGDQPIAAWVLIPIVFRLEN